jgi:hypothetical protein
MIEGGIRRRQYGILNYAKREPLLVVEIAVAGQDLPFELFLVGVPELGSLGVQWARTMVSCQ